MDENEKVQELLKALEPFAKWMREIREGASHGEWVEKEAVPVELDFRRSEHQSGVTLAHLRAAEATYRKVTEAVP